MTRILIAPAAEADLGAITDHYLTEAGFEVAIAFLTAWESCTAHIDRFPASGSPRLQEKLNIAGLRVWPVKGFPHLAMYLHSDHSVTIIRVLHAARDIPGNLRA